MFEKLKDLLGMNDGEQESLSYRSRRERELQERQAMEEGRRRALSPSDLPSFSSHLEPEIPEEAPLVLVRGDNVALMADDLIPAIEDGQMVLLDFHGAEPATAQHVLQELVEVARTSQSSVYRISGATFLFCPFGAAVEEWVPEPGSGVTIHDA